MSEEYYEATLDHPCPSCKCLELDDAQLGGKVEVDSSGTSRVSFGQSRATVDNYSRPADHDEEIQTFDGMVLTLDYYREDMFPNLSGLAETARQGCEFCAMLRQDLWSIWSNNVARRRANETERPTEVPILIHEIKCQYRCFSWSGGDEWGLPWLDTFVVCFRVFFGGVFREGSLSYNVSADSFDKCAGWLNIWRRPVAPEALPSERMSCLLDEAIRHDPPPTENLYLPTRLIDVGSRSQPTLRLVVPKYDRSFLKAVDPASKRYIALSYCWGSREDAEMQLKTTGNTLNEHLEHLQHERLPQTIADAVELCRALNIRYLWVDALCIIQGDAADWARESFEMSNIYANSFWTVCVLRGNSCSNGFLHSREVRPKLAVRFHSALDASVLGKFYLSQPAAAHENINCDGLAGTHSTDYPAFSDFQRSAWITRGWAFQEEKLSTRMILFGDRMFHVNCASFHESEDGSRFPYQSLAQQISRSMEPNQDGLFDSWYEWVHEYACRDLTVTGDKLPALSAIARTVSGLYPGQRYLAGLWEADLHRGLFWRALYKKPSEEHVKDRKNEYIAPSWSWACDSHIPTWNTDDSRYLYTCEFELRDAKLETEPGNPFGRVSAGHILLNAKLFRVPLGAGSSNAIVGWGGEGYAWLYINPDVTLRSQEDEYIADFHFDCDCLGGQYADGYRNEPIDQLWMIYISSSKLQVSDRNRHEYLKDPEITFGLLLIPNENGDGFLRVGLFYSDNRGLGGKKFWESIPPCEVKLV